MADNGQKNVLNTASTCGPSQRELTVLQRLPGQLRHYTWSEIKF